MKLNLSNTKGNDMAVSVKLSEINFPSMIINNNNMVCKIDDLASSIDTMNIIREIIINIDCNPMWIRGGSKPYDIWTAIIAKKATEGLRSDCVARGAYSGRKTYSNILIDASLVDCVIKWIDNGYKINISNYERVENSPICIACGNPYELMWNRVQSSGNGTLYKIIWGCPVYNNKCAEAKRIFRGLSPEAVHMDGMYKVFMHNYIKDGNPIPIHYLKMPLTEWTLVRGGFMQTILSENIKLQPKAKANTPTNILTKMSTSQISTIKATFDKCGPTSFFESFPNERGFSWNDIMEAARLLGVSS
jgi:hypothetical protein